MTIVSPSPWNAICDNAIHYKHTHARRTGTQGGGVCIDGVLIDDLLLLVFRFACERNACLVNARWCRLNHLRRLFIKPEDARARSAICALPLNQTMERINADFSGWHPEECLQFLTGLCRHHVEECQRFDADFVDSRDFERDTFLRGELLTQFMQALQRLKVA